MLQTELNFSVRFEVITAVKIQIKVFWVVTPCSVAVRYQYFIGPCCCHLQSEVNYAVKGGTDKGWENKRG